MMETWVNYGLEGKNDSPKDTELGKILTKILSRVICMKNVQIQVPFFVSTPVF